MKYITTFKSSDLLKSLLLLAFGLCLRCSGCLLDRVKRGAIDVVWPDSKRLPQLVSLALAGLCVLVGLAGGGVNGDSTLPLGCEGGAEFCHTRLNL